MPGETGKSNQLCGSWLLNCVSHIAYLYANGLARYLGKFLSHLSYLEISGSRAYKGGSRYKVLGSGGGLGLLRFWTHCCAVPASRGGGGAAPHPPASASPPSSPSEWRRVRAAQLPMRPGKTSGCLGKEDKWVCSALSGCLCLSFLPPSSSPGHPCLRLARLVGR